MPRAIVPRPAWLLVALTLLAAVLAAGAAAALVVAAGWYDVAASRPHTQPVFTLMETTLRQAVRRRAATIDEPALATPLALQRGAACYRQHCEACHGGPGVAPGAAAQGMQPLPGPLVDAPKHWRPRELAWITRNGIRMSGMPAWAGRLADEDLWAVVAFVERLPQLVPADYAALPGGPCALLGASALRSANAPDDLVQRGRDAVQRHGCQGCHVVPGVVGGERHVGPPLAGFARRTLIGGHVPNTPENLVRWLRDPAGLAPGTAMPPTVMDDADAQAIAAYLATLR